MCAWRIVKALVNCHDNGEMSRQQLSDYCLNYNSIIKLYREVLEKLYRKTLKLYRVISEKLYRKVSRKWRVVINNEELS